MGRKTKKIPETVEKILNALRGGLTHQMAYDGADVSHDSFYRWIKEDPTFAAEVDKAESAGNARLVIRVRQAAEPRTVRKTTTRVEKDGAVVTSVEEYVEEGDWQAAMRLLECRDPKNFGKKLDVTSNGETLKGYGASVDFEDI